LSFDAIDSHVHESYANDGIVQGDILRGEGRLIAAVSESDALNHKCLIEMIQIRHDLDEDDGID
jgi:hypothetical protein